MSVLVYLNTEKNRSNSGNMRTTFFKSMNLNA